MIPLPTARRRAEELDAALASRPGTEPSAELRPLLDVVAALRAEAASAPAPRPAFSASLREALMAEAETVLVPVDPADEARLVLHRSTPTAHRQRRIAVVAAAAVISGASATTAYAAQDALPGDTLYGVKRALEGARDSVSLTDAAQGAVTLRHAEQRLAELQGLVARDDVASASRVPGVLDTFTDQTERGSELILADAASSGDDRQVERVREFVVRSITVLDAVYPSLGDDDREALGRALALLRAVDERALEICGTCGSGTAAELPFSLANALSLFDSGVRDLPELPDLSSAAGLPPGSVSGGATTAPLQGPAEAPTTEAPQAEAPATPQEPAAPSAPQTPAAPPPTSPPTVPPVLPPGGTTGLTDPLTEQLGPLGETLRSVTGSVDRLLGLDK